jgi:zinc protease
MPIRRFLAVAALVAVATLGGRAAEAAEPLYAPNVTTFTIANGLQVVVIPNHRAPVVTHMVYYKVGAADEQPGKSGIAHFLEHLMFKGTTTYPAGEFSARIAHLGGNDNATTTDDTTSYYQTVAKQHLGLVMSFEADRMANLVIDDQTLLPEREVILEERSRSIDNSPSARLGEAMNATLYVNSHYGIPPIGWAHEMATLTRQDALDWYNRYYTPNNAVVVVAGDVDEAEVRALVEQTYGKVPRRAEPPPRVRPREPVPLVARTMTYTDERVTTPSFRRLYLVPSEATAEPGEADALDVLAEILSGNSSSRFRKLVTDGIANGVRAGYLGSNLGDGAFSLAGSPREGTTIQELEVQVDKVLAEVLEKGVTEDEVQRAKRGVKAAVVLAEDSPASLARAFGASLARGLDVAYVQHWPDRTAAVTVADVNAVARKYLIPARSVTGYLLPAPDKSGL